MEALCRRVDQVPVVTGREGREGYGADVVLGEVGAPARPVPETPDTNGRPQPLRRQSRARMCSTLQSSATLTLRKNLEPQIWSGQGHRM